MDRIFKKLKIAVCKEKGGNWKSYRTYAVLLALLVLSMPLSVSADSLKLYAAGSLTVALGDVAASYEKTYKIKVITKFGPSGLLRKAIEGGENADVFASADMEHPEKLASSGWGSPVVLFARNQLCVLAQSSTTTPLPVDAES